MPFGETFSVVIPRPPTQGSLWAASPPPQQSPTAGVCDELGPSQVWLWDKRAECLIPNAGGLF